MAVIKTTTSKNLSETKNEKNDKITVGEYQRNIAPQIEFVDDQAGPVSANGQPLNPIPVFNKKADEKILDNPKQNCMIRMGNDRMTGQEGYGATGHPNSSAIDIVAGMTGKLARVRDKNGFTVKTNPSAYLDAARIYISQRCDADQMFGITRKQTPRSHSQASVVIKADHVRVVAREALKLVTGTDMRDSDGKLHSYTHGIYLIAGNDDSDMQPMVKGDNLVKCLDELFNNQIGDASMQFWEATLQATDAITEIAGVPLNSGPVPLIPSIPSPIKVSYNLALLARATYIAITSFNTASEITIKKRNWLEPEGDEYILSTFNKVN